MLRQMTLNRSQCVRISFHNVVSAAAMDVYIDKARRQHGISEVNGICVRWNFHPRPRSNRRNNAILNDHYRILNLTIRGDTPLRLKCTLHSLAPFLSSRSIVPTGTARREEEIALERL